MMNEKENLTFRISELERVAALKPKKFKSCVGVIKVMLEEEHFFPDAIAREVSALEALLNQKL